MATTPSKRRRKTAKPTPRWRRSDQTDSVNGQKILWWDLDCGTVPKVELSICVMQAVEKDDHTLVPNFWEVTLTAEVNESYEDPLYTQSLTYKDTLRGVLKRIPGHQRNLIIAASYRLVELAGQVAAFTLTTP